MMMMIGNNNDTTSPSNNRLSGGSSNRLSGGSSNRLSGGTPSSRASSAENPIQVEDIESSPDRSNNEVPQQQQQQQHPSELAVFVQDLLEQMETRFSDMEDSISGKLNTMGNSMDELESSVNQLMDEAGLTPPTTTTTQQENPGTPPLPPVRQQPPPQLESTNSSSTEPRAVL